MLLTWRLTLQSYEWKTKKGNVQKCTTAQQKNSQIMMKWQQQFTECGYNSTVLIILSLVSPLVMFILHKKHTYCSMRRNYVISSFLETLKSRSGHTKEINKINRTGTYKVTHHIGLLHTSHHTEANLELTAVHNVLQQQVKSSGQQT